MKRLTLLLPFILVSCAILPTPETQKSAPSTASVTSQETGAGLEPTQITPSPTATTERARILWTSIGPGGGGWLPSMAFAPPDTLYVGCDVGGVYRSRDGGVTFEIINQGLQNYIVQAIAVHPENPAIVFLGTGGGLYRSTDEGDHWDWMRSGFPPIERYSFSAPITSLAFDPSVPEVVYAGVGDSNHHRYGQGTIYKTEDGGESWFIVNTGPANIHPSAIIYSILVHPQDSNTVFASTDYGVYKSADGGRNWEPKNGGLPHTDTRNLAMHPSDPEVLYLTVNAPPNESPWLGGVYKSVDGGETWQPKNSGLGKHVGDPGDHRLVTSNYENILINPENPEVLYVGAISWWYAGIYKTTNGGESWRNVVTMNNVDIGWISYEDWGIPQGEAMALDPNDPERVFFGDAWQLFKTEDGGVTWGQTYTNLVSPETVTWRGRGLETTVVHAVEVDPTDSNTIYIGYADVGFHKSTDGGMTFKRSIKGLEHPENIFDIEVDPDRPNVIYATCGSSATPEWDGSVVRSEDAGRTWQVISSPDSGLPDSSVYTLVLDPTSPLESRILYAASFSNGLYKSEDGGVSWVEVNNGLGENGNRFVSSIVIHPDDPNLLYAGVDMEEAYSESLDRDQYGGVYKSLDGGSSWIQVDHGMPNVLALVVDVHDPQTIYAATREYYDNVHDREFAGGVFRSADGGETWIMVLEDPFVMDVVTDPHHAGVVYAATGDYPHHDQSTGHGVFRSDDSGTSWYPVNEGLTHLAIWTLEIDPLDPATLYLGTGGNGVFKGRIED